MGNRHSKRENMARWEHGRILLAMWLFVLSLTLFCVFLCLRLDGMIGWSWLIVVSPLLLYLVFACVLVWFVAAVTADDAPSKSADSHGEWLPLWAALLCVALFVLLLALRSDGSLQWHWTAVFSPLLVTLFVLCSMVRLYIEAPWRVEERLKKHDGEDAAARGGAARALPGSLL